MATTKAEVEVKIGNSQAIKSMGDLKRQLKEANFEALAMAETFGRTSAEAINAARRVAQLKDAIGDAKAFSDAFNPDAKFTAFSGAIQGVVGGFTALQGAQALFGEKSKAVEETLLKVQAALALSQGINQILEAKDAFSNLGAVLKDFTIVQQALNYIENGQLKTNAELIASKEADVVATEEQIVAQETLAVATTSTGTAMKVLRAILVSTGIGALALGIGLLIEKIVEWTSSTDKQKEAEELLKKKEKELEDQIAKTNSEIENRNHLQDYELQVALNNAKAKGASIKDLQKIEDDYWNTKRLNAQTDYEEGIKDVEAKKTQYGEKSELYKTALKQQEKLQKDYYETNQQYNVMMSQRDVDAYNKKLENQKKYGEKKKENDDKIKQAEEKLRQETKALNDQAFLQEIKDEDERTKAKIDQEYANKKKEIEQSIAGEKVKQEALKALYRKYQDDIVDFEKEKNKKLEDANKDALKQANALATENYLNTITNETQRALEKIRIDNEARVEEINQMKISEFEKTSLLQQEEVKRQGLIQQVKSQAKLVEANKKLEDANNEELDFQTRLQKIQEREGMENQITFQNDADRTAFEEENSKARIKLAEDEHNAKVQFAQDIGNALGALSDLVGQQTAVGKGLAVAQATINTWLGATEVLRAKSVLPEPMGTISKIANVAAIVASGIKSVKSILATKVPNGGGGGTAPSESSVSAPITPQMSSTSLNQQMINTLQGANASTRAYVVESDVSGNQERIQRLNRAARIS